MTRKELINVFKYIVKKCDMLINNGDYEADDYTQDTVEDIAELCNHILDGDYGRLIEVKEVNLEKHLKEDIEDVLFDLDGVAVKGATHYLTVEDVKDIARHFFELGLRSTITEEDCKLIWNIGDDLPYMSEEEFFKELLRRYKAKKGQKV